VQDAAQLANRNPRVAIIDVGEDVGDRAAIDGECQSLARFQLNVGRW
jgi:hypothetical protein